MTIKGLFFASLSLACLAAPAAAQNPNAEPNYGEIELESGFAPDPRVIALRAGGSLPASNARSNCRGFITEAPDVRLHYEARSLPLIISVAAPADTTLVVNGPDGTWYCDDDGGENGLNPSIRLNDPASGRYEIWVGTYRAGATQNASLHISEVRSQ
jgi:hypothetical protein